VPWCHNYRPKLRVTCEEGDGDNGDEGDFCTLEHDHEDTTIMYTGLKGRLVMRCQRFPLADWKERPPHKVSEDKPSTGDGAL
jgi:hypothetical protein